MVSNFVDKYSSLPGVKVDYEDGNLYTGTQNLQANTPSITLIGSAIDGPVGEPVSVAALGGPKAAEKLFGGMLEKQEVETGEFDPSTGEKLYKTVKVPHAGSLIRGMYEALNAGNEDIRLVRVDGQRAKTELPAEDIAQALVQNLGNAAGNVAFSGAITLTSPGRLSSDPIEYIREKNAAGNIVKEYTGSAIDHVVLSVDSTSGSEKIYFDTNKFRPGNKLEVKLGYKQRTYTAVTSTDADAVLTQDATKPKRFASTKVFWSDDLAAGHVIKVYVDGNYINQTNASGEFLFRVGNGDPSVTNPLTDLYTAKEHEAGGITFTSLYDAEVANGVYPALSGATVKAEFHYYSEVSVSETEEYSVPGSDTTYALDYVPTTDAFAVYFEQAGSRYNLVASTATVAGDYSMIFPETGSAEKVKVIIKAGVVPVGLKIYASYKTKENKIDAPKLVVEGRNPGSVYGGLRNVYKPTSLYGVQVEVREDITTTDATGYHKVIAFRKPEEKRLTSRDEYVEYRTRELSGVRTLREFANIVNADSRNNVVYLSVSEGAGEVPVQGLLPTKGMVSLGQILNTATGEFELYKDETKAINDPKHFPWLGDNGFFDRNDLSSMKKLYEKLGGTYELVDGTYDEYVLVEQGVYNKMENYATDEIVLLDAHTNTPIGRSEKNEVTGEEVVFADSTRNFATQLAQHCAIVTAKTWETVGTIGMEPVKYTTLASIQSYIDEVSASGVNDHYMFNEANGELILNEDGEPMDIGRYISVVFGPEVGLANDKIGNYVTNGGTSYAGLISTLPAENSTTNQQVPVSGLRYHLSEAQHNQLAAARFVTFEEKRNANGTTRVVVKDGMTGAQPTSDFHRLSTVRITHATVQLIRRKADPFIGLPNGIAQRNSLATEIQAGLDALKENGVLQDFKFSIFTSAREQVLGNAFITLELVPQFEMRKIFTSVALRASL